MAAGKSDVIDPVEAAKHGVGSSRRLIAASLDDLSAHHSWLETYHRDERLRAERMRRRDVLERLKRIYQRTLGMAKSAALSSYVEGRRAFRSAKRHARTLAIWLAPRVRALTQYSEESATAAWRWTRQRTPLFARRAIEITSDGFSWSVGASERAGCAFRRRASSIAAGVTADLQCKTVPIRQRGAAEWTRTRMEMRRVQVSIEQRVSASSFGSQTLAWVQRSAHRGAIRAVRIGRPVWKRAHAATTQAEIRLSTGIIEIVPGFRRLLRAHMPNARVPKKPPFTKTGYALMIRPTTALACVTPAGNRLPVLYNA